jgi:hypothetical protein
MQKDDVVEVTSGKLIAVHQWRLSHALDNGSTISRIGFFDTPADCHISGAQVPKFLDII